MHKLWAEQLSQAVGSDGAVDLALLGDLVSSAYAAADRDLRLAAEQVERHSNESERVGRIAAGELEVRTAEVEDVRRAIQEAFDRIDQGVIMSDADKRVLFCNKRALELLDLPPDMMARQPGAAEVLRFQLGRGEFIHSPEELKAIGVAMRSEPVAMRYERRRPNGLILDIRTIPLPDGGAVRTYSDVTDLRARESDLRRAEAEYRSLFENAIVGLYRSSLDGRQLRANPALVRLNGYESEEEMLAAVHDIAAEWYVDPTRRAAFQRLISRDGRVADFVSEVYRHKTRERIWVSEAAWLVRDKDGAPLYYEGAVVDITERRSAEARITWLAHHDPLTNLANRAFFVEELGRTLAAGDDEHLISALAIDLGRFREINDALGHDAGDQLLRMAARRIRRAAGPRNLAARLGSDEFAVIVADATTRSAVLQLCERIIDSLYRPFRVRRQRVVMGATVGVAFGPEHGEEPETLLRNADAALTAGRDLGSWPYAIYNDDMNAGLQQRRALEADLRKAVQRDELFLHFQPIVDVASRETVSAEALIRWRHPTRGDIAPGEFIPIAEETGFMIPLGEWTLAQACREAAQTLGGLRIAVNISPVQFRSDNLVPSVLAALNASGLTPEMLEIEITETMLLRDDPFTLQALMELRALGVSLALDDFGAGNASFGYLLKFQFDKIKIDRAFVKSLDSSRENAAIVRAVVNLAADLGVKVVAEGVETEAQLEAVRRLGCGFAQGYLFSRPMPAAAFPARAATRRAA